MRQPGLNLSFSLISWQRNRSVARRGIPDVLDRAAEVRVRNICKEVARRAGLTEAEVKKLYDDD
jgi:hypothetical protein